MNGGFTRLETTILEIFNSQTGKTEKIRAFLDRGSQITVISTECAKRCSLPMEESEPILLSTFGNKVSRRFLKKATVNFYKEFEAQRSK